MSNERRESRQHERFEVELDVRLVHAGGTIEGRTVNLSLGGMLVRTAANLPFGTAVTVHVTLPAAKEASELPATVRWVLDDTLGIQFGLLRAKDTWALNQLHRPK